MTFVQVMAFPGTEEGEKFPLVDTKSKLKQKT